MKEDQVKDFRPQLPEPTDEEIEKANTDFKGRFGRDLSKDDAVQYATLRNELGYWLTIEKSYEEGGITENMIECARDIIMKHRGEEVSPKQASLEAEKSLLTALMHEKVRIQDEIKKLINGRK